MIKTFSMLTIRSFIVALCETMYRCDKMNKVSISKIETTTVVMGVIMIFPEHGHGDHKIFVLSLNSFYGHSATTHVTREPSPCHLTREPSPCHSCHSLVIVTLPLSPLSPSLPIALPLSPCHPLSSREPPPAPPLSRTVLAEKLQERVNFCIKNSFSGARTRGMVQNTRTAITRCADAAV